MVGILRIFPLLIFAAFLAGCTSTAPLQQAQENVSSKIAQPDRRTAAVRSEAKRPKLAARHHGRPSAIAENGKPAMASATSEGASVIPLNGKPVKASATSKNLPLNPVSPKVGSPEWEKEKAENEAKERHIKKVIANICRGC